MGAKQRRAIAEQLAAIPDGEERVLLATGRYIGEGFDDARLDTLFSGDAYFLARHLAYVGRLHRLHDNEREVIVYDYVDGCVPAFSARYSKRVRGYEAVVFHSGRVGEACLILPGGETGGVSRTVPNGVFLST